MQHAVCEKKLAGDIVYVLMLQKGVTWSVQVTKIFLSFN